MPQQYRTVLQPREQGGGGSSESTPADAQPSEAQELPLGKSLLYLGGTVGGGS